MRGAPFAPSHRGIAPAPNLKTVVTWRERPLHRPKRRIVAEALVVALALACVAAAARLNPAWLYRHFLPEFFEPRPEQLQALVVVRGVFLTLAVLLLWPVRRWLGRLAARKSPVELAADVGPVLVAVVLAFLAGEVLLRQLPWFARHELPGQREPLRRRDPVLGWSYKANHTGHGALGGRMLEYVFDAAGHRVRSQAEPVDYARPSVVFMGESIIGGHGLTYDETIPTQVGARLGLQPANLAVGGYATDQMYLRLKADWPNYRQPRALVVIFMPALFHRNLELDRPHLDPGLVWRPQSDDWRLAQIARRLVPYRSDRELAAAAIMTRQALTAMVEMARARGAVPLILVPQLTPETAEEAEIRAHILAGLPYLQVVVDPALHIPNNRHPDARGARVIADAVSAWLLAHGVQPPP
jgi:hypothetical protein